MSGKWTIPLDRLAAKSRLKLETVARKATFDLFRSAVLRSPVDTGRFRANHNVSYGTPNYTTTDSTASGRGLAEAQKALSLPVGGVVYMTNALPYARRLEYGWSKQAPAGIYRVSAIEFSRWVQRAAR